ncbi:MAG TPA: mRNA surveillance protein pelota [Candidatus Methanoperedenaceae archaeon]|nr:mRNA surveillance protein pelota [Candidatus Methanoperedenaceae archaeon]
MRVIKKELRGAEGEISLVPESIDDLWHLKYIIGTNDLVFSFTKRRVEGATDKLRPEKAEKRPVRLGIRVEKVEFHRFANRLRVHGIIADGIDTGDYHTLNIEEGTELSIIKRWRQDQLMRIDDAVAAAKRPRVIIVTIEEGEGVIGVVRQYGVEEYAHVERSYCKGEGNARQEFFGELAAALRHAAQNVEAVVIAGPGFTKEDFLDFIRAREPEIAGKSTLEDTASIGVSGFQEALRRGAVDRIAQDTRIARESRLMEELLIEISKDGKAAYGIREVKGAQELGAVETLLIADEMLRDERGDAAALVRAVERARGHIVVFSTGFEPGKKLEALGGVAALLRFRVA